MSKPIDLAGKAFGRLKVIKRIGSDNHGQICWECKCVCGNIVIAKSYSLRKGRKKSCGCLRKEISGKRVLTHGMSKTPEYKAWRNMRDRCYNANDDSFQYYGGRGITVCDEWKNDFMAFFNYIGKKPSPKHSLDRINNDGNYEPGNVRWALPNKQQSNTRYNRKIKLHGITMNITQWSKFSGIKRGAIYDRLNYGWPPAKAIFQPVRKNN